MNIFVLSFFTTFNVDYHKRALMNLNLCLAIKKTDLMNSRKDEFSDGHPKRAVVPDNIDAVPELTM